MQRLQRPQSLTRASACDARCVIRDAAVTATTEFDEERRRVVRLLASGAVCTAALGLSGCSGFRYVAHQRDGDVLVVAREAFGDGPYALLKDDMLSRAVYLHQFADGSFGAVSLKCAHRGCEVEPAADRLACPATEANTRSPEYC